MAGNLRHMRLLQSPAAAQEVGATTVSKLSDVNTTDIRDAIRLGCRTMCSVFNADDNDIPFFGSSVWPQASLGFSAWHSESHVPGRHLNALLNAEDAAGIEVPEEAIEKHANAAFFSYSGPVPLPLNRESIGGPLVGFCPHNIREGFHALYALVKYRKSERARELAEASIAAIFRLWDPDRGWDREGLTRLGLVDQAWDAPFVPGLARALGPLVKYYRATGYGPALELAIVLKEKALADAYREDGAYDPARFGTHGHSVTCVLSSLAQLADLMCDSHLMARVKAFYDHGLWDIRDELGWCIEAFGGPPDRGECNNTGDILETAVVLGRWGYAECFDDAERILRGHLLPSQLRDVSFIQQPPNPNNVDGLRDMANRHRGAFGFPAPYGHQPVDQASIGFNMDIVGGAVGSLCEAYRGATRLDEAGHWVNLLFDHETDAVAVRSPYTHSALRVLLKRAAPLLVRIPSWVDAAELQVDGHPSEPLVANRYLLIAEPPVGTPITVRFPLKEREIVLNHRTRDIRVRLRGDQVVAMDNFGGAFTFFDPIE
jgi:hypothetical protein